GPIEAIRLAAVHPEEYSRMMHEAHLGIAAFGGTFLMMVGLSYFFDPAKDIHWVGFIERRLRGAADVRGVEIAFVLIVILFFSSLLDDDKTTTFQRAAIWGLVTFLVVDVARHYLDHLDKGMSAAARGGLGAFLYLEVLDASFSFDGVIGA